MWKLNVHDLVFSRSISDGPSGEPNLQPPTTERHSGEKVTLRCINLDNDGNPDCDVYTWNKTEGNGEVSLPQTQTLEFIMDESWA